MRFPWAVGLLGELGSLSADDALRDFVVRTDSEPPVGKSQIDGQVGNIGKLSDGWT